MKDLEKKLLGSRTYCIIQNTVIASCCTGAITILAKVLYTIFTNPYLSFISLDPVYYKPEE